MTFRDYAQGCWRMRGLGQGQTMMIFMIPEVANLISEQVAAGESTDVSVEQRRANIAQLSPEMQNAQILTDVTAWLTINSMRSEKMQFNLLCEQMMGHVWRKTAYRTLIQNHKSLSSSIDREKATLELGAEGDDRLQQCIDVFRERLDYSVENVVPVNVSFAEKVGR